jgi:6-pyruvoyltetrahydropterin/6-carboxytetrahydropterin synthase
VVQWRGGEARGKAPVFELSVEAQFSAAHCIRGHPGRCARLHGHNYRVVVSVSAERLDEQGMVMDFADLKAICNEAIDPLDHTALNDLPAFTEVNPTAEELARHIYRSVVAKVSGATAKRVSLDRVTVYESQTSYATYRG